MIGLVSPTWTAVRRNSFCESSGPGADLLRREFKILRKCSVDGGNAMRLRDRQVRRHCQPLCVDELVVGQRAARPTTEAGKICGLAEAFNITCTPHSYTTGVGLAATIHLVGNTPICEWLELDVIEFPLYEELLVDPFDIDHEGRVSLPTTPGLGVELPESIVEEYGLD